MAAEELVHIGTVTEVSEGRARVRFTRTAACKRCGACLSAGDKEMETCADDKVGVKVGDRVVVSLKSSSMLIATTLCYAIPLALLLIGTYIGSLFSDVWAVCLGLGSCAVSYIILRLIERRLRNSRRFTPIINSIVTEEDEDE
ncbi:MAG: SoxR reducing system RseC family protein [Clostridia bacterium]|nr:SoxR reducing system RseC family protein [Clostridia bacterium]